MISEIKQLTILIPSYNRPEFLFKLLKSILNDHYNNIEVIVSDDASPRQSEIVSICNQFADKISFYTHKINLGEKKNKSFLISKSTGKYNLIIGDDDIFESNNINEIIKLINTNPEVDLFLFGYRLIDKDDNIISVNKLKHDIYLDNNKLLNCLSFDAFPLWFAHPNTFICKAEHENLIGYDHDVGIGEDMFFIQKALIANLNIYCSSLIIFNWRKFNFNNNYKNKSLVDFNQSSNRNDEIIARMKIINLFNAEKLLINKFNIFYTIIFQFRFIICSLLKVDQKNILIYNELKKTKINFFVKFILINIYYFPYVFRKYLSLIYSFIRLSYLVKIVGLKNTLFIFNKTLRK